MDQSAKRVVAFELNVKFEDDSWHQILINAGEDDFNIFYRETETDHTDGPNHKIPQRWIHRHELSWSHTTPAGPQGQRNGGPRGGLQHRSPHPVEELREEETREGFGDKVREVSAE